ncbi:DUF3466 family protein [Catenovulum adriaticum]|uniref:DUF3466 family protein n=1 Tax=Catenovulum adriaticum TaxID=2984846 RepID=A0ABY7APY8_9ALTE|nr:DUF3466 family protein [Catenovulum sp. TS8]WAJ71385.1 DUF3466 family protein [Catenovulum sp. TS8]
MINKILKSSAILGYIALQTSVWAANTTTYRIEVIETPEEYKSSFPIGINNQGDVAAAFPITGNRFEFPVDVSLLDFDQTDISLAATLSSFSDGNSTFLDSVKKGRFNSTSLSFVLNYLAEYNGDGVHQQIGLMRGALSDKDNLEELAIFDVENPETDEYTYFHTEQINDINSLAWIAGSTSSPLTKTDIDGDTWLMPEFIHRGFVRFSNRAVTLPPFYDDEDALGGFSYATDISDSGYVVGYASVAGSSTLDALIESCRINRDTVPEDVCLWRNLNNVQAQNSLFRNRAYLWKVNGNGDITEKRSLGIAIDNPDLAESLDYTSRAFAVNDKGLAVGESSVIDVNNQLKVQAVLFNETNVFAMTNPLENPQSRAIDINNNDIVIGTMYDTAGLSGVLKSFYYDIDSGSVEVTPLSDFFVSANTKAKAINDQNIIVGETDAAGLASGTKPKHGFVYDISTDEMQDLNDLLSCETDFTIVDAVDINDDGVILARASLVQTARDLMGNSVINSSTDSSSIEQVEYTVKLIPDLIAADSCDAPDNEVTIKRKGASFTSSILLLLFITFLFKRRNIHSKTI